MNTLITRNTWRMLSAISALLFALSAQAASFDCGKAKSKVEHIICDDAEISRLDDELNESYKAALKDKRKAAAIKKAQKLWMKGRNKCRNNDCLNRMYEKRILALMTGVDTSRRWYLQQGEGKPLCESLVRIANKNPSLGSTPNIPWDQVLLIKGVREPDWIELNPAEHENLFLMARDLMAANIRHLIYEQILPFAQWFKSPKERWFNDSERAKPITDDEALGNYRDFVNRGGKLKVLHADVGDETGEIIKDIVQYESPSTDVATWDGYSLLAETGLTRVSDASYPLTIYGRGVRILIYENNLFSFFKDGGYLVAQLSGERTDLLLPWYCKVDSKITQGDKQ